MTASWCLLLQVWPRKQAGFSGEKLLPRGQKNCLLGPFSACATQESFVKFRPLQRKGQNRSFMEELWALKHRILPIEGVGKGDSQHKILKILKNSLQFSHYHIPVSLYLFLSHHAHRLLPYLSRPWHLAPPSHALLAYATQGHSPLQPIRTHQGQGGQPSFPASCPPGTRSSWSYNYGTFYIAAPHQQTPLPPSLCLLNTHSPTHTHTPTYSLLICLQGSIPNPRSCTYWELWLTWSSPIFLLLAN